MTTRKLTEQLGTLKAIKPRTEWRDRTRDILLSQIKAQGTSDTMSVSVLGGVGAYTRDSFALAYRVTIGQLFVRPLVLSGFLSVLLVGAISVGVASEKSIPGDPLYAVKQTHEQIKIALVAPEERSTLQFELAQKRLEEMGTLSDRALSTEEKEQKTALLVQNAQENIANVQKDLDQLKKEEPKKAVQVAALINQKAGEYEQAVTNTRTEATAQKEGINSHIQDVIANLDETQNKALAVIVDKKDTAGVAESEVASHITDAIAGLEERLARLEKVSAAGFQKNTQLSNKSNEAKRNLQDARDGVERRDFKVALDRISLSRGIIASVEKELDLAKAETDGAQTPSMGTVKRGDIDQSGSAVK